jgi:hypothetical protein
VPGVIAESPGDVTVVLQAKHRDHRIPKGGKVLGRVAAMDLAGVFLQCDVANVVGPVLDAPVTAPPGEQATCSRQSAGCAGHGVVDLGGLFAVAGGGSSQTTHLSETRPIGMACQARADFQTALDHSAVFLGERLGLFKMRLAKALVRRGKKPPENRRRLSRAGWADCL